MNSAIIQELISSKGIYQYRLCLIFMMFFFFYSTSILSGAETRDLPHPLVVSDRLYFDGPEGNAGLAFQIKFLAPQSLTDFFRLDNTVGTIGNRLYSLKDVLVDIDFDGGNANWASARISGPKPVIIGYLNDLEKKCRANNLFTDFSWNFINFKPTAYYETEAMGKPVQGDILSLSLSTNKVEYSPEELITIQATIKNNSNKKLTLVKAQDGSTHGIRYPMCVIELKNEQGLKTGFNKTIACKTVNPLEASAFFEVEPGKAVELFPDAIALTNCFTIQKPGIYYLMIRYSTVANHECRWYGAYDLDYWNSRLENEFWQKNEPLIQANRLNLADVEQVDLRSEWVKIEIKEAKTTATGVSKAEAESIAEKIFTQENWPTNDISVRENGEFWDIQSNSKALGVTGFVRLKRSNGEVVSKHIAGP
ncbi:MAG: hypothetical protein KKB51_17320 [Candidatus Riflebacteria bacterium]|nr:hypothetical protein [Candidatus Riflebacteria bacterium]